MNYRMSILISAILKHYLYIGIFQILALNILPDNELQIYIFIGHVGCPGEGFVQQGILHFTFLQTTLEVLRTDVNIAHSHKPGA